MNSPATQPNLTDARRGWALQLLELPEPGQKDSAAEVLQRLADAEFVPSASWRQAMHALVGSTAASGGQPSSAEDSLLSFGEEELRREIEEFAGRFFSIAPDQRRGRWQLLRASPAMTPALALRLDALTQGFDLAAQHSAGKSPDLDELAELTARLSVLRPGPRAQLRREKLTELGDEARRWQLAAAGLERHHPALAALAPDLLRGIQEAKPAGNRPAVPLFRRSPKPAAARTDATGGSRGSYWWVGLVMIAFWVVRAMISSTSHQSPSPYNSRPTGLENILRDYQERSSSDHGGSSSTSPADDAIRGYLRFKEKMRERQQQETPHATPFSVPGKSPNATRPDDSLRRWLDSLDESRRLPGERLLPSQPAREFPPAPSSRSP